MHRLTWHRNNLVDVVTLYCAQGLGSGWAPLAPGTFGTLPGVALYLLIDCWSLSYYIVFTALLFVAGIPICGRAANILQQTDPPSVVFDEVVGYLVTMIAVPSHWLNVILGFVLFRLFDIWKPWPIGYIDRQVSGGFGIMLDDLVAGLMAMLLLHLLLILF